MDFIDYYGVMGLEPSATAEAIKRAYRKLARQYHPDVSEADDAEERFKAIGEAYAVLKDADRRREYDALRDARERGEPFGAGSGAGFGGGDSRRGAGGGFGADAGDPSGGAWRGDGVDFSDFFRDAFGEAAAREGGGFRGGFGGDGFTEGAGARGGTGERRPGGGFRLRGEDVHAELVISLQDAHDGTTLPLSLRTPTRGEDGSLGIEEKTLQVKIPVGVTDGRRIRLRGQGGPGIGGGESGDLYIELGIAEDPRFTLDGRDVTHVLGVSPWEAALGARVPVPTLGGEVRLNVPPRSSGGRRLRLKGRGLPGAGGAAAGDQFVVLRVELPMAETDEQTALYEAMARLWPDHAPRGAGGTS